MRRFTFKSSTILLCGINLAVNTQERLSAIMEKFAEARELLGDARESHGTSYFSEDISDAKEAVDAVELSWNKLKEDLISSGKEDEMLSLERENGVKIRQLFEEFKVLCEDH
eukprot:Tbor_TRINITY_DN6006_c0_g2::TRINITY_DN6006_c0_g2_i1::g.11277::m.11277